MEQETDIADIYGYSTTRNENSKGDYGYSLSNTKKELGAGAVRISDTLCIPQELLDICVTVTLVCLLKA